MHTRIIRLFILAAICIAGSYQNVNAQSAPYSSLQQQIDQIAKTVKCKVALGLVNIETGDTFSYNGREHMPTMSTVKLPLALMVMQTVDDGRLKLDAMFHIPSDEIDPNVNSAMMESLKGKKPELPIRDMLYYMITASDNVSCNVFTRLMGGAPKIEAYAKAHGMNGIHVSALPGLSVINFINPDSTWCEPMDMALFMRRFYKSEVVSNESTVVIRHMMEQTTGGAARIKGLLPKDITVAHKTGTGQAPERGVSSTVNDIGIVTLPNGNHLVLAVYVTNNTGTIADAEGVIAKVAKAAYDATIKQ